MYDKGKVLTGLAVFVIIVGFPFWYNAVSGASNTPNPQLPKNVKHCVKPLDYMRTSHMKLLLDWRDEVLREGKREKIVVDGVEYEKSLMNGCLNCHKSEKMFCNQCHQYAAVDPYCWDCHIKPKESN